MMAWTSPALSCRSMPRRISLSSTRACRLRIVSMVALFSVVERLVRHRDRLPLGGAERRVSSVRRSGLKYALDLLVSEPRLFEILPGAGWRRWVGDPPGSLACLIEFSLVSGEQP